MNIYKLTNTKNGLVYIGKTSNVSKRIYKHKFLSSKGVERPFYDAIRQYGIEAFKLEVLEDVEDDVANEREKYWISYYDATNPSKGYNRTIGGDGGDTWTLNPHKEETSRKIVESHTGKSWRLSEESKKAMRQSVKTTCIEKYGVEHPSKRKGVRERISETLKKKYASGEIKIRLENLKTRQKGEFHQTEKSRQKLSEFRKGKTYEELMNTEVADNLRKFHKEQFTGKNNPRYKEVDMNAIKEDIRKGLSYEEIRKKHDISIQGIMYRLQKEGLTIQDVRNGVG